MTKENFWTMLASGLLAFFEPITGNIMALAWVFVINFLVGLTTGVLAQREDFSFRKFLRFLGEATLFFVLSASIYVCGKFQGNMDGAVQTVSLFVYVVLFFYTRNVLRNLRILLVEGSVAWCCVDFAYSVLSFEFAKRIPLLDKYLHRDEE